jgi:broad specificity phosphatase PhoE
MFTFLLVRHGQTEANYNKVVMGQGESKLTPQGIEDARYTGNILVSTPIEAIYASDLGRTQETTKEIVSTAKIQAPVYYVEDLREINYGIYNNTKREELRARCSAYRKDLSYVYPQGESVLKAQQRAVRFVQRLENQYENKTLLLVSHSGIIRGIINYFQNIAHEQYFKKKISNRYIAQIVLEQGELVTFKELSN